MRRIIWRFLQSLVGAFGFGRRRRRPQSNGFSGYTSFTKIFPDSFEVSRDFLNYEQRFSGRAARAFNRINADQFNGELFDHDIYSNYRRMNAVATQQRLRNEEQLRLIQISVIREQAMLPHQLSACEQSLESASRQLERMEALYESFRRNGGTSNEQ